MTDDRKAPLPASGRPGPSPDGRIRIPPALYRDVVFPALEAGYREGDPEACYLLGRTWHDFVASDAFAERIGFHSAESFHERAYRAAPGSARYRHAYLDALIARFEYRFHEWPSGIVLDHDDWPAELAALGAGIEAAAALDEEGRHAATLGEFREKTALYRARLSRRDPTRNPEGSRP